MSPLRDLSAPLDSGALGADSSIDDSSGSAATDRSRLTCFRTDTFSCRMSQLLPPRRLRVNLTGIRCNFGSLRNLFQLTVSKLGLESQPITRRTELFDLIPAWFFLVLLLYVFAPRDAI